MADDCTASGTGNGVVGDLRRSRVFHYADIDTDIGTPDYVGRGNNVAQVKCSATLL